MNLSVAVNTGKVYEMEPPVTFRTEIFWIAANQQKAVGRPMGLVANHASLDLLGKMLINPGPPLLGMAFKAGLVLRIETRFPQTGSFPGSMRIMAFRALQSTLEYFVGMRKVELRLYFLMTREAELHLVCP